MIVFLIELNFFTERYREYRDYSRGKLYYLIQLLK